jgi:hypothetical protein
MEPLTTLQYWELASYVVTVVGLPMAIFIFAWEQWKDRENDEYEVFQSLSDNYQDFLKVVLENPDLKLVSQAKTANLSDEQRERMMIIFGMLISLFERAYLLLYGPRLSAAQRRRWRSWEDYMREWCQREDFRAALPALLSGEDAEFSAYIASMAKV